MEKTKKIKWKYKYKNLFLLGITTFLAVFILRNDFLKQILSIFLSELGYFGVFLAGIFFTYTLTTPLAASALILYSKNVNLVLASVLAAFGAVLGDYLIFSFVKHKLAYEIKDILKSLKVKGIKISEKFKRIVPVIAGFIIASPLPDEIGVALLGMSEFKTKNFIILCFSLHFFGILSLMLFGKII